MNDSSRMVSALHLEHPVYHYNLNVVFIRLNCLPLNMNR